MTSPLIRIRHLVKCYGSVRALHVEHFDVLEGDRVLLTGRNGSGKSTLVRLLAGVGRPTGGTVEVDRGLTRQPVGYVPQSGGLHPDATVRENLGRRLRLFGTRLGGAADHALLDALGLEEFLDTRVSELSVGYQRLALVAAAFLAQPRWMLWDEPFAGVDADKTAAIAHVLARATPPRLLVLAAPEEITLPGMDFSRTLSLVRDPVPCAPR
jgi:ABC-type multidrug transport system ATPase subunit